jgi:ABC-type dipeptide/oligopeptide/nickel transport system permease subunit
MAVISARGAGGPLIPPAEVLAPVRTRTLWYDAWLRLKRNRVAMVSAFVLLALAAIAIVYPLLEPNAYRETVRDPVSGRTIQNQEPSAAHWFGTDKQSRDVFSRVLYGTSISMSVGVVSELLILFIGVPLGLIAGYFGKWVDQVLMRLTDIMYAFPTVLFAIVVMTALGPNLTNIYFAIGFTFWPPMARLVRSQVLSLREKEFVESARAIGVSPVRIMFAHILPNTLGPVIVAATFGIPYAILVEAFLSFIGIGVPIPYPSWGAMIAEGRQQIRSEPWLVIFPSIALAFTLFAFNFFGDGLRDALDPRSRK